MESYKKKYDLKYHAYEKKFFEKTEYVNEGFNPHICWRNKTPEDCIRSGKTIYMLLHPHWWFRENPFEDQRDDDLLEAYNSDKNIVWNYLDEYDRQQDNVIDFETYNKNIKN